MASAVRSHGRIGAHEQGPTFLAVPHDPALAARRDRIMDAGPRVGDCAAGLKD